MCKERSGRWGEEWYECLGMNGAGFATGSAAAICCISAGEESFGLGDGVFPYLQTQLGGKQGEELKGVHLRVMGLILGMMVCGDVKLNC
tara:strand:+ start:1539 stop:1805 length:267 start_codon:yes stop_codon:yes gene_type:complete